jgi:hypothetical protein
MVISLQLYVITGVCIRSKYIPSPNPEPALSVTNNLDNRFQGNRPYGPRPGQKRLSLLGRMGHHLLRQNIYIPEQLHTYSLWL